MAKASRILGIAEVGGAVSHVREKTADEQASRHAGQADEKGAQGDAVDGIERRQADARGDDRFGLQAALLNEVENRGRKRDEESGVGGKQQGDVEEEPAGVQTRDGVGIDTGGDAVSPGRDGRRAAGRGERRGAAGRRRAR